MSYRISREYKDDVGAFFKVPTDIIDNYISPMTDPQFVLVLLWVFCHSRKDVDIDKLSEAFSRSKPSVSVTDALDFWVKEGILESDGVNTAEKKAFVPSEPVKEREKAVAFNTAVKSRPSEELLPKLTNEQIMMRIEESSEIKGLMNYVQELLGRTIGFDMQSSLVSLHDTYGMPVEVIPMLVEYCVSIGKSATSYIVKMGRSWAQEDITTIEKADKKITDLRRVSKLWKEFSAMAGLGYRSPTQNEEKYLNRWNTELGFGAEIIYFAYEQTIEHCGRFMLKYTDAILRNWREQGIRTPAAAQKALNEKKGAAPQSGSKKNGGKVPFGNANEASYDIEEFKRRSRNEPLIYEKRKK